jgi:peptidoglycan/xylan/chitin deacetylase (PgdA/CDA1 family)
VRLLSLALCGTLLLSWSLAAGNEPPSDDTPRRRRAAWPKPALGLSRSGTAEVLFTFDDGPQLGITDKILDTLGERGVRAVFFVAGWRVKPSRVKSHAMVQRMLEERHLVGNHTTNHMDLCLRENREKIDVEIDEAAHAIQALVRMAVPLFRAPYGARCAAVEEALAQRGISHLHWDIDPQEWRSHDADETAAAIIGKLRELRDDQRAVVLIHDTKDSAARALPMILDWIAAENTRRAGAGRKPLRILDPAEVVLERLAPGVAPALGEASETIFGFLPDLQRRIFAPLGIPIAKASL